MKIVITESQYNGLINDLLVNNLINEDVTSQTSSYPTDPNKIKAFQDWVDSITNGWILIKNTGTSNDGKFKRLNKGDGYGVMGPQTKKLWDYLSTAYNFWNQRLANPKDTTLLKKFQDSLTTGKKNLSTFLTQQRKEWEKGPKYDANPNVPKTSDISKVPGFRPEDDAKKDIAAQAEYAKARESTMEAEFEREREARLRYKLWSDEMDRKGFVNIAIEDIKNIVLENIDDVMEDLRGWLGGIAGGVVNTILELTGFGALAVSVQWAALLIYDFSKQNWIKFIFSLLGLLTSGALGQALYKPFQGIWKTKVSSVEEGISTIIKNPTIKSILGGAIDAIVSGVRFVSDGLKAAGKWLINTFNITWAQSAINWIVSKIDVIIKLLTGQADDVLTRKASEKVATKIVVDPANTYIANTANVGDEYKMVKAGSDLTKGGSAEKDPGKVASGVTKIYNKVTGGG